MKGLLEQMRESRVNAIQHNMMKDDGSFVTMKSESSKYDLVLYTGRSGMIEFEIAIHYQDKNWVHPEAVKTHPPFVRSAGKYVGVDATGKRWRYHRVNGVTYWIDYGWEYTRYNNRFKFWELNTQNQLIITE